MEDAHGIVIRLTKLTDSSLIVHWMTRGVGLIKTVAKGARRPKSVFGGRLDLFVTADLQWQKSRQSDLHTLREVSIIHYREAIRKSYRDAVVAGYFGQLLELVLELEHPEPELFSLLERGLGYLEQTGADLKALLFFEKEVGRMLGLGKEGIGGILRLYGRLPFLREQCLSLLE